LSRALATAPTDRVSTLPTWCGVKAASGNWRRCSSTRSRSAPGRVAGAGGLLPRGVQVAGREGPPGLVGGLGDGQDVPGGLGGDGRVRLRLGADFRLLALGGAVSGDWGGLASVGRAVGRLDGGLPGVGGAARGGGLGGRGLVARGCRGGGGRPGVGDAGPAALDAGGGAVLLVREQSLPGGGCADAGVPGDDRDGRPGGFGRQGGQDGRCRTVARRRPTGAGARFVAVSAVLRAALGAGCWCAPWS